MKHIFINVSGLLFILLLLFSCVPLRETSTPHPLWVTAYYAGWMQGCGSAGHLSPERIDYSAVTHIIHFAILPNADGTVDFTTKCLTPENSSDLVREAHANRKKVLVSLGGWLSEARFLDAAKDGTRELFIENLIKFMVSRGYDGIDIDWEPLSQTSTSQLSAFIIELRKALDKITPRPLLTAAAKKEFSTFASLQDNFDQINIMTYSLSGPRPGWITWHNAPVYHGGRRFPSGYKYVPSTDSLVKDFISAGVREEKLGIGIAFFGHVWSGGEGTPSGGVTAPGQEWTKAPTSKETTYYRIMDDYFLPERYRWDNDAKAAYLSIDEEGSSHDKFISYDDETSCREKIKYAKEKGLGGIMIFELGGGWRPGAAAPDNLLQTIKDTLTRPVEQSPPGK